MQSDRDLHRDRGLVADLRSLYLSEGVIRQGAAGPIVTADGWSARWMVDSLSFSLGSKGAALAADALLKLLERFEGRQLATYGTIGLPLMQSVVLRSNGRYHGLLVRKEVKAYGSRKRIEGRIDPREPVVLIDDSITTGDSMMLCAHYLREAGLEVEGGVFLTRFGFEGVSRLQSELGVPMAVLFDVERDFYSGIEGEVPPPANGLKTLQTLPWSKRKLREGLDPCTAARQVIEHWLSEGRALLPPARFDAAAPHQGGTFVSLRNLSDLHHRPARGGFWHLPSERPRSQTEDLVWAAVQTAIELKQTQPRPKALLDRCGIAVTTFSALEQVPLAKVDAHRHGIVVRSLERPWVMGGALPNMPGLRNARELFEHAGWKNAQLLPTERYEILRHEVFKRVEPSVAWQPTGVPSVTGALPEEHAREVTPLLRRALAEVRGFLGGARPAGPEPAWPEGVEQLYLTFFRGGALQGCMGTGPGDASLRDLARAVVNDERFERAAEGDVAVALSFLRNRQVVGRSDPEWLARVTRYGEQALEVWQEDRSALLLPAAVTWQEYDRLAFPQAAIDKAGIRAPPYDFAICDVVSWGCSSKGVVRLRGALSEQPASANELKAALTGFLARAHRPQGEPFMRYLVFRDVVKTEWVGPWLAHRAWVKARLSLTRQAREDLARFQVRRGRLELSGRPCGLAEHAFFALASLELSKTKQAKAVLQAVVSSIGPTGRFEGPEGDEEDFYPYQALLALAAAVRSRAVPKSEVLERAFAHYRRRWRGNHAWGSYAWAAQAFTAWGLAGGGRSFLELACEVADWGLSEQSELDGCFETPLEPEPPSAMTAVYLEGVAAALHAARALGDRRRQRRYRAAFERGVRFVSTLVISEPDRPFVPNFEWARGGLRTHPSSGEVRLDYVQHALNALHLFEHGVTR